MVVYLSKGILARRTRSGLHVSHCGALHNLSGIQAVLWLDGSGQRTDTRTAAQNAALTRLSELGIVAVSDVDNESGAIAADGLTAFRLLTNCVICPKKRFTFTALRSEAERRLWRWLTKAGLRLTIAELVLLNERGILPTPELLGEDNRQALTEVIYTEETIYDGILESLMGKSPFGDYGVCHDYLDHIHLPFRRGCRHRLYFNPQT